MNATVAGHRKHIVRARRISFAYPTGTSQRHYADGDPGDRPPRRILVATFPEGEDFFVRSVRNFADRLTDPELRARVQGFIGQEVSHGREHRALNERLQQMGYPTRWADRSTRRVVTRYERRLSPLTCLAITAALEHFTAVLAETLLADEGAQATARDHRGAIDTAVACDRGIRAPVVAFDVYQAAGGGERRRIAAMWAMQVAFTIDVVAHTTASLLRDRATYDPARLVRSLAALPRSPLFTGAVRRRVRAYNKVGFHPDDTDNTALLEHWTAELFGDQGSLVDHLR